jgi:hypothetical protein
MDNKQHIEQYIKMHREAFDDSPLFPECGWKNMHRTLDRIQGDAIAQFIAANRIAFDTADCPASVWTIIETDLGVPQNRSENDGLEQFISSHRNDFDTETPDLRVWDRLSPKTPLPLTVSWKQHLMRSAAAIVLLIAGVGIGMWYSTQQQQNITGMRMSDVSAEYAEIENHFERDIQVKKQHLAQFTSYHSSVDVLSDLSQMDNVMEELRLELANVPPGNREEVVRAMIDNYKIKAKVLERVLKALEEHKTDNNSDDRNDQNNNDNKHEKARI